MISGKVTMPSLSLSISSKLGKVGLLCGGEANAIPAKPRERIKEEKARRALTAFMTRLLSRHRWPQRLSNGCLLPMRRSTPRHPGARRYYALLPTFLQRERWRATWPIALTRALGRPKLLPLTSPPPAITPIPCDRQPPKERHGQAGVEHQPKGKHRIPHVIEIRRRKPEPRRDEQGHVHDRAKGLERDAVDASWIGTRGL